MILKVKTLYVVACSATKTAALKAGPVAARDAYAGQVFTTARRKLEAAGAEWCILSGKYGILWPDTVIEHYEQKLEPGAFARGEKFAAAWSRITEGQHTTATIADPVIVLGSRLYAEAAAHLFCRPVESPLAGLPIGRMKQRLASLTF